MLPSKKPDLAILIGTALKKKGLAKGRPEEDDKEDGEMAKEDHEQYLQDIASDMLKAIDDKDPKALADLLRESFECLEAQPHEEAEHDEEDESY